MLKSEVAVTRLKAGMVPFSSSFKGMRDRLFTVDDAFEMEQSRMEVCKVNEMVQTSEPIMLSLLIWGFQSSHSIYDRIRDHSLRN